MPGPPDPSDPVAAAATGVGPCEPFAVTDVLAEGVAVALGDAEAVADGEAEALGPVVGRADEVVVVLLGATLVLGAAAVGRGAVVRGCGLGVAFTVGLGVGFGVLVADVAGGAERGFCPEPNLNPTTVPGAGSWLVAPELL